MLLADNFLAFVVLNLKYLNILGQYPYNIDSTSKALFFVEKKSLKLEKTKHVVLLFICLVKVYQLYKYQDRFLIFISGKSGFLLNFGTFALLCNAYSLS